MKTAKSLSYRDIATSEQSHQIKCYLKLYNSNGLSSPEAHLPSNYEILDQNTLMRKTMNQSKDQYEMYPFTRVFSARIGNELMSKSLCFADDLEQGINHTTISLVDQATKRLFTTGSNQQHGILLEYFLTLFEDFQNRYYQNKASKVYLSLFATVNCKANQYIDLINGQRYTYLSKKDVDTASYKTFHELQVQSVQEYLICLKITIVRYQECCNDADFIVFRLTTLNEDEFCEKKTVATGNVIICHQDNKNTETFLKQVETLVNQSGPSGQLFQVKDHGSLFSCIEPYLRNGKLSIIQCVLNEHEQIQASLQQIKRIPSLFMNKTCTYKINKQQVPLEKYLKNYHQKIPSQIKIHKHDLAAVNTLTTKELDKFTLIFASYKQFIKESTEKLLQFGRLYKHVIETRDEFYEKQRFPVSLQIKNFEDVNFVIKSYYISKVYSLSEKFQMPSLEGASEKMTTIKHQIYLSLKALASMLTKKSNKKDAENVDTEQNNHSSSLLNNASFSLNKSYDFVSSPTKKARSDSIENPNEKSSQKFEKLTKMMRGQVEIIKKNLKYILNIDSKSLMQKKEEIYQNQLGQSQKKKLTKLRQPKETKYVLDDVDFGQLFGQELIMELERLLKNLLSKRELSNGDKNNNRESVEFLVGPGQNRQQDGIKDSMRNSLSRSKNNSLTRVSQNMESSLHEQNSRIIMFTQKKTKNISSHVKQSGPLRPSKRTKRRIQNLDSEPQTLEQCLLEVKMEQLSKHLQIRREIQNFQNESKLMNSAKVALGQVEGSKEVGQTVNKGRIKNEKQNMNTHITEVCQDKASFKEKLKENTEKYQLIHQNKLTEVSAVNQNNSNDECGARKTEQSEYHRPQQMIAISQIIYENDNSMKQFCKRKPTNQGEKAIKRSQHKSTVLPIKTQKQSMTIGLPQIRRSIQKTLEIDPNRQTFIHSPKHKKKQVFKVVNNNVFEESHGEMKHKKRFDSEGKRSFLPGISLMVKKICG